MSISCAICNQTFEKIIPWQHLRIHGISSAEYKEKYGSLYSPKTLAKFQSRIPHNKGKKVTDPAQLDKIKQAIKQREERFQNGEFSRGKKKTAEQKQVLSEKTKQYAASHQEEMRERAKKAVQTKIQNGVDFSGPMRGKKHSDATKQLIRARSKEASRKKSHEANLRILDRISTGNLQLLNSVESWELLLQCNVCRSEFSFTKQYFHLSKFTKELCPVCYPRTQTKSEGERELYQYIQQLYPHAINGYRKSYHSKEIDIFIPELNIGFEFNGLYWHSEPVLLHNNKSPKSDFDKKQEFKLQGIKLIQIFEDEWHTHKEIVKSRIANILRATKENIYARKCIVKEISSKEAADFCNKNHIMGAGRSNIRFGLYFNHKLVSVMTFSQSNISRKVFTWELNRFASQLNTNVIGGASKLFRAFIKHINPTNVISYADNRWSDGNLYKMLGFEKVSDGTPNYWYILPNTCARIHRFSLRKTAADPKNSTEKAVRESQGYSRIWDSGSSKWVWTNKNGA